MEVIKDLQEWRKLRETFVGSVGFVPTMGALHEGHLSLIKKCRVENDLVVLSIFVNPTQFDQSADLENYPDQIEGDLKLARDAGVDYVILPRRADIYPDNYTFKINESSLSHKFCGAHRPGHFDGVLTIVMKLFQIVRPQRSYFGEKDYQQLQLIKKMCEAFFLPVEVVACKTVREESGLALSSRNLLLNREQKKIAPKLFQHLGKDLSDEEIEELLNLDGFNVDYVETIDVAPDKRRRLAAVKLGDGNSSIRLIDNVEV